MKVLQRLWEAVRRSDNMQTVLFAFLASGEPELKMLGGKNLTRADALAMIEELLPARIEMRAVCANPVAAVAAAPHVSFDNWSEYFCTRVAKRFSLGHVVAKNFRDQDPHTIPAAIGRHVHVNRQMESSGPGRTERVTPRAEDIHQQYLTALQEAPGKSEPPFDLLLEFHSHHRTPFLEIATSGVDAELAQSVLDRYQISRSRLSILPEMQIEPLHEIRMTAENTKRFGSLRPSVARFAFHMEIPREARREDFTRNVMCKALFQTIGDLLNRLRTESDTLR
jgi:hypothetical protein